MADLAESVGSVASEMGFWGVVRFDDHNGTLVLEAFGLAHRGFGLPNTVDTQFAIASGGKGFRLSPW
jgi:CubicO group peptidase (beta-lactamase class C family)